MCKHKHLVKWLLQLTTETQACGKIMYGDYLQQQPRTLTGFASVLGNPQGSDEERLRIVLASNASQSQSPPIGHPPRTYRKSGPSDAKDRSQDPSLPSRNNRSNKGIASGNTSAGQSSQKPTSQSRFLELCVNRNNRLIRLEEICLTNVWGTDVIQDDFQLFCMYPYTPS